MFFQFFFCFFFFNFSKRANVARYKDRIHLWQIENELNEAWLASVAGQRRFQFFGSKWRDWSFLTTLLSTLRDAVKDEDASALVTTNFHTDVAKWVHDVLLLKGYYEEAVSSWSNMLDIVSIDAYPNMLVASPCLSNVVAERYLFRVVFFILHFLAHSSLSRGRVSNSRIASQNKSVFVMEWSYPMDSANGTFPGAANFSNSNQVLCIKETLEAVKSAGGDGFMYFKFQRQSGIVPPPGGYSDLDLEALKLIAMVMSNNENPIYLLEWLQSGLHLQYLEHRLPILLSSIQQGFGLITLDGKYRPGLYELKKIYESWN